MTLKPYNIIIGLVGVGCMLWGFWDAVHTGKTAIELESKPRDVPVTHLVIHSFVETPEQMLDNLRLYGLSVHYMIDAQGQMQQLVPEDRMAWHAGPSFWAGVQGLNKTSIGIELEHSDMGQTDFPKVQIDALVQLAKDIIIRHHIRPENVVAHSDIAPEGKMDPGRGFPWHQMAEQGIGLWYDIQDADKMPQDMSVSELLAIIGYPVKGRQLTASAWAFRERFMPEKVPYDAHIAERGDKMFLARQQVANLPLAEREKALAQIPPIYPPDDGTYLTDPDFIRVLRAVAYRYQQQRIR